MAIADNRVAQIDIEWNPELLATLDVDLKQFWDESELKELLKGIEAPEEIDIPDPKIDQAADLQKKWGTKPAQIWEIGKHRLMCGSCTVDEDVAALMEGKKARLCATDPPYLVSYDGQNHPSKDFSDGKNKGWKGRYADKQKDEPLGPFYEAFLKQALSVCEKDAGIYVWHASQRQIEVEKAMRNCGILVHQQIIWVKNKPVLTHSLNIFEQRARVENDLYSADCESVSSGLPEPDLGGQPVINPPDSIAHYEVPDGSIVRVIRRQYEEGKFTAFVHQTWQDGGEYHGDYTVRSLADPNKMARPIAPTMATLR